jgi:putative transposase
VKYAWITQHRGSFPVAVMCDVLNVSPSGYYDSIDRPPSARAERHERIQQAVQQAHAESHGIYGSYKVAEVMRQREDLESACRNTVASAMRCDVRLNVVVQTASSCCIIRIAAASIRAMPISTR